MAKPERSRIRSLNEIPEDVLIIILALLPTRDSVRSSILSRKWRNLWSSVPAIDFDYKLFPQTHDPEDTSRRFSFFVDQTLRRRSPVPINKFRLQFDSQDYIFDYKVNSWMKYAISHTVQELEIDFCSENPFELRLSWLKRSQVRHLKLLFCGILIPSNISSLKLHSIRSLDLWSIDLTDRMVAGLMSACINLESLAIEFCKGFKKLKIRSSTLKKLSLNEFDPPGESWDMEDEERSVEISCPNLICMSIDDFKMDDYSLKNSKSLVEGHVGLFLDYSCDMEPSFSHWSKVVRLFSDVKHLTLDNQWYKLLCKNVESSEGLSYRNLDHLELRTGYSTSDLLGMAALFEISPNITTLTLTDSFSSEDSYAPVMILKKPIEFCIPNLKNVYLSKGRNGVKKETGKEEFVSLIKKYGASLEKIVE